MSVIRSESKLKDVDEKIQALFDEKHVKIIKAEEEAEEEAEKTQEELIGAMCEAIISNAESIQTLITGEEITKAGLICPKCGYDGEPDESGNCPTCGFKMIKEPKDNANLERIAKSLENIGLTGKWQSIKKRIKIQ